MGDSSFYWFMLQGLALVFLARFEEVIWYMGKHLLFNWDWRSIHHWFLEGLKCFLMWRIISYILVKIRVSPYVNLSTMVVCWLCVKIRVFMVKMVQTLIALEVCLEKKKLHRCIGFGYIIIFQCDPLFIHCDEKRLEIDPLSLTLLVNQVNLEGLTFGWPRAFSSFW